MCNFTYLFVCLLACFSPLLEYFHVTPSDLWPNTEVFYRELELSKRRENVKRKQALNGKKKFPAQKEKTDGTSLPPPNVDKS